MLHPTDLGRDETLPALRQQGEGRLSEYRSKGRACLSIYNKAVSDVFHGKAQPLFILSTDDTTNLNVVVERA